MISRAVEHGTRRAEELRESAATIEEVGIEPILARAIAERQDWAANFRAALAKDDLGEMLDAINQDIQGRDH
jgi:hypothetical protein